MPHKLTKGHSVRCLKSTTRYTIHNTLHDAIPPRLITALATAAPRQLICAVDLLLALGRKLALSLLLVVWLEEGLRCRFSSEIIKGS